jgi:hypothetical protein
MRVVINKPALNTYFRTEPAMTSVLRKRAVAVREAVIEEAPHGVSLSWPKKVKGEPWVRRPMRHGRFKESVKLRKFPNFWRVTAHDEFARMIEFGTVNNPAYSPFRRTVRAFGGQLITRQTDSE